VTASIPKGIVLNIQHFSTHDGPGIRTNVFLKGCTLRCKWCSNPESIHPKPELAYNPGTCVPACPFQALYLFGQEMTVDEVLDEVEQDSSFYRESGGGMTLSGGECQMQADFAAALLAGAHQRGINTAIETAIETASNVPWDFVAKVLPHVDTVLHNIKLTDPERHKKWTGVDNTRIRANLERAYETFPDKTFIVRTPLIPGVNDDEEHIRATLEFIKPHKNVIEYELLPYMRFGESKYGFLGRVYEMQDLEPPTPELLARLWAIIAEAFCRQAKPK
jgi:pyruvate formate lyase activating enzyme